MSGYLRSYFSLVLSAVLLLSSFTVRLAAQPRQATSTDTQTEVTRELEHIKERQTLLVDAAARDLERAYFVFSVAGVFFAAFSGFLAFRQLLQERRQAVEEQRRAGLEQQQFSEIQSVMTTFRENIVTINSLITSLTQTFDLQKDIRDALANIDSRVELFDQFKAGEEHKYRSEVDSLNSRGVQLYVDCQLYKRNRDAFKHEDNKVRLDSFAAHFDTLERTGDCAGRFGPVSLLMRALAHFNSTEYPEAADLLRNAREFAKTQLDDPLSQYGTWDADEVRQNLHVIIAETGYHLGIIGYNLGHFEDARKEFSAAFEKDPLDFRSRIYIPEIMFFEGAVDPAASENEFALVEQELNNLSIDRRRSMTPRWENHMASLKMRQGNFHLPKLVPLEARAKWKRFENAETATQCFWASRDANPDSAFAMFSLAQGMHALGQSTLWKKESPEELFQRVFYRFRNDAILKTEPILLTLLHYCSAIACWLGRIERENPTMYLGQARQHLQRVPRQVRVFSPINKINMPRQELLGEMEALEKLL